LHQEVVVHARYRFIVKLSFDGSRLSKLTLNQRNSQSFLVAYLANPTGIFLKVTSPNANCFQLQWERSPGCAAPPPPDY